MDKVGCCPVGCRSGVVGEGSLSACGGEITNRCVVYRMRTVVFVTDEKDAGSLALFLVKWHEQQPNGD